MLLLWSGSMNPYVGIIQIRCAGLSGCLLSAKAAPRVCSLHDRTKPPACQGRNIKSSPLCGTGTLHGCGFRLYTRCVKQKRELVSAKILNVTGGRDEPFQAHRIPSAAARAFSHLLLYFGFWLQSGLRHDTVKVPWCSCFYIRRLWILHGEEGIQVCGPAPRICRRLY